MIVFLDFFRNINRMDIGVGRFRILGGGGQGLEYCGGGGQGGPNSQ